MPLDDNFNKASAKESAQEALIEAVLKNDVAAVKESLQRGADPNAIDANTNSVLITAVQHSNIEVARALIDGGADINIKNEYGYDALGWALLRDMDFLRLMLDSGADVNSRDYRGMTILMLLISSGGVLEAVQLLLDNGADIDCRDPQGRSALDHARSGAGSEIVKTLEDAALNNSVREMEERIRLSIAIEESARHTAVSHRQERIRVKAPKIKIKPV